MPLPTQDPAQLVPADPPASGPVVGAAELARLARLFAARGILLVQCPPPSAEAPVCPQCGAVDRWFTLLLTQEPVCQCRLTPAAGSAAG